MTGVPRQAPFVGLRPFEADDSHLFFGRREQLEELLQRLHDHRLVAVVGSSGCGKSSLVRAGLVPALKAGFLVRSRAAWRVLVIKPGKAPMRHLAEAVLTGESADEAGAEETAEEAAALGQEASLCGAEPLVEHLGRSLGAGEGPGEENVLLVVDQFEELFRFGLHAKNRRLRDEAADFVSVLLDLVEEGSLPVYVVLTMRADFIRDCDDIPDLPEALNRSLFLVPRLTREQFREAIEGPVRLAGAEVSGRLLDRLLNDSSREHDELPVLQHALLQTWREWAKDRQGPLDLPHYERAGTAERALDLDAERALDGLSEDGIDRVRRLFQALTAVDPSNRKIRSPARPSELEHVTGVPRDEIRTLLERFRSEERSLLVWSDEGDDPLVDISHESLIRNWRRLDRWADEEAESVDLYRDLARAADDYPDRGGLLQDPKLQIHLDWRERRGPTRTWAERVAPEADFERAMEFLEESRRARDEERARREREREEAHERERREAHERHRSTRRWLRASAVVLVVLVAAILFVVRLRDQAVKAEQGAVKAWRVAEEERRGAQALGAYHELVSGAWTSLRDYPPWSLLLASAALSLDIPPHLEPTSGDGELPPAERVFLRALSRAGGRPVASGTGTLTALEVMPESRTLLTADAARGLICWDLKSHGDGSVVTTGKEVTGEVRSLASAQELLLVGTEGGEILALHAPGGCPDGEPQVVADLEEEVHSLTSTPDGRWFAALDRRDALSLWRLPGEAGGLTGGNPTVRRAVLEVQTPGVRALAFGGASDTLWLAIGRSDGRVEIRSLRDGSIQEAQVDLMPKGAGVKALAATPGADRLVVARSNSETTLFDLPGGVPPPEGGTGELGIEERIVAAQMAPGGRRFVTWDVDGAIGLRNLTGAEPSRMSNLAPSGRSSLREGAFSADGDWLFTGHFLPGRQDSQSQASLWEVRRWNLAAFEPATQILVHEIPPNVLKGGIYRMAFSPDRTRAVVLDRSGGASLWSLGGRAGREPARRLESTQAAAFAGDGHLLVVRQDGTVATLPLGGGGSGDVEVIEPLAAARGTQEIAELAVSRDGRLVMTADRDGRGDRVRVWSTDTGTAEFAPEQRLAPPVRAAAFTPDGEQLITAGPNEPIRVHDLASGDLGAKVENSDGLTIHTLGVSPDGRRLVTGGDDGVVRFWDLSVDGGPVLEESLSLESVEVEEAIVAVSFTPQDGKEVLVTTESGVTHRWPVRWVDRYRLARKLVGKGPAPEVVRSALESATRSDVFAALAPDASEPAPPESDALTRAAETGGPAAAGRARSERSRNHGKEIPPCGTSLGRTTSGGSRPSGDGPGR